MGSVQAKPTITDELTPFLPYMGATSDNVLVVDPNVRLVVKQSRLPSGSFY